MTSNFEFMNRYWSVLYQIGSTAEAYLYSDPNACIYKLGQIGELVVQEIVRIENIAVPYGQDNQYELINRLSRDGYLTCDMDIVLETLRKSRNAAVHKGLNDLNKARSLLRMTYRLTGWFVEVYLDPGFITPDYVEPKKEEPIDWESMLDDKRRALEKTRADLKIREEALAANQAELAGSRAQLAQRQADLDALQSSLRSSETALADSLADLEEKQAQIEEQKAAIAEKEKQIESQEAAIASGQARIDTQQAALRQQQSAITDRDAIIAEKEKLIAQLLDQLNNTSSAAAESTPEDRHTRAEAASARMGLTEAETRALIDAQLREAGWEADTENLRYGKGARPKKGHNMAIAEWPVKALGPGTDRADYALFIGLQFVGIIEAKRARKDVPAILDNQCRLYAANIREEDRRYCVGQWHDYSVPFLFATNGRKYLKQLETASGVWFRDVRPEGGLPRALQGWYSPEGLTNLLSRSTEEANRELENLPLDVLTDPDGLNLRDYQVRAIEAAEKAVIAGKMEILISMATGTGKTRTILGFIYRMLKTGRFRRILFLVDRNALGAQAQDVFKEARIDELMTLDNLYNIKELGEGSFDPETRIQVATVQSLVRRLLNGDENGNRLTVSDYNLIIIDEAHRGYTLDREMTDTELEYRDQADYISKYRMVVDYFDAVKVAMTATPALHTTQIFGKPVFTYSYREAVVDGWLVDHDAPHNIVTKLRKEGIRYQRGEQLVMVDPVTGELLNGDELPDDLSFDVDDFNRKVITENFNRTVFNEVCRDLNPFGPEKTLIYAVDDRHADLIVRIIREIYQENGVPAEAVRKITGSIGDREVVRKAIREFKNETYPTIVATVDLLTTGIDVPQITSLAVVRRIKSRILFEQMLGRATRLCPEINKTHFDIYDAVGVYETISDVTNMKAVSPSATFAQLLEELKLVTEEAEVANTVARIAAKLHRKSRRISAEALEHFKYVLGEDLKSFARYLRNLPPQEAKEKLLSARASEELRRLDLDYVRDPNVKIIDDHADELLEHSRGFGEGQKPEDYIESFGEFIRTHRNEMEALQIVCTRPSNLTREALKGLRLELEQHQFTEKQLCSAWKEMKNEDIAADIIAFIRQQALGSPLISHEDRVRRAFARIRQEHSFNAIQKSWLDRIEKTMLQETVLDPALLNEGAYRTAGGFNIIDRQFGGGLREILDELNQYFYDDTEAASL